VNPDRDDRLRIADVLRARLSEPAGLAAVSRAMIAISLAVGAAFILVGGWWIHRFHMDEFIFNRAIAQGRVIENRPVQVASSSRFLGGTSYRAIVRFRAQDGREVTLGDWVTFTPPSFSVGQVVGVFYDPGEPEHAMIDRGWKNYLPPGIPGVMGLLMILGGVQRRLKAGPRAQ
jgi:hypothetical protein